jgi:hypothetical protein
VAALQERIDWTCCIVNACIGNDNADISHKFCQEV